VVDEGGGGTGWRGGGAANGGWGVTRVNRRVLESAEGVEMELQ